MLSQAVRAGGEEEQLAAAPGPGLGEAGDQPGESVVGDGEDDHVAGGDHLVRGQQRNTGQPPGGAHGGGGGQTGGGVLVVAGGGEGGPEGGADPAGSQHADAQSGGSLGGRG